MTKYFGSWSCHADLVRDFHTTYLPSDAEILIAVYGSGSYSGDSFVLYEENGRLFENNAHHCSCYGLENGWGPEPTSFESLKMRVWDRRDLDDNIPALLAAIMEKKS